MSTADNPIRFQIQDDARTSHGSAVQWDSVAAEFHFLALLSKATAGAVNEGSTDHEKVAIACRMMKEIEKTLIIVRTIIS